MLTVLLAACTAGKPGDATIAFLRDRSLWTIQPDGSPLLRLTAPSALGFAWSPDHHQLAVRFAATTMPPPPNDPLLGASNDVPAGIGIISIDGGNILAITPIKDNPVRSDIWWNINGNRLLYREQSGTATQQWIQSQSDQPGGIARKTVSNSPTIPTTAPDGSHIATITAASTLVIGAPEQPARPLQQNVVATLPTGYPARPLWQPHHDAILYASAGTDAQATILQLTDLQGKSHPVASVVGLQQYSWSPNGDRLLWRTARGYTIHALTGGTDVTWDDRTFSVPWWSPDGRYIVTQSATALTLVNMSTGTVTVLATLHDTSVDPLMPAATVRFQPLSGSIWKADSSGFVLVTTAATWFNGADLATKTATATATGMYVVKVSPSTTPPALIDWGEHQSPSWSTPNPNTQFVTPYYLGELHG